MFAPTGLSKIAPAYIDTLDTWLMRPPANHDIVTSYRCVDTIFSRGSDGPTVALTRYTIVDAEGVSAELEALDAEHASLKLNDGRIVMIPRAALSQQADRSYHVEFSLARFLQDGVMVIPVVAEQIDVEKRNIERSVRVKKSVESTDFTVDEDLVREDVDIEHVMVNRYVDVAPQIREEDGVTVIPLIEEVLVVEKRLLLREEIRITRRQSTEKFHEVYTLQREKVHVERDGDINTL